MPHLLHLAFFLVCISLAVKSQDFTPATPLNPRNPFELTDAEEVKRQAQGCGYITCGECIQNDYCGWCKGGGCLQGTAGGPTYTDYCSISNWQYYTCTDCSSYTSCASCSAITTQSTTPKGSCVWCESSYRCVEANPTYGARTSDCSDDTTIDWNGCCNTAIPSDGCQSCTRKGCGYCESDNICKRGSSAGPAAGYSCANVTDNWKFGKFGENACPGCGTYLTGEECTADPKCGWCGTGCVDGSSEGPAFTSDNCNPYDYGAYCSPHKDQASCTPVVGCGWCEIAPGYGTCFSGSNTEPFNGFPCSPWIPNPNNPPPPSPPPPETSNSGCAAYGDGDTCTSYSNCIWCTNQGSATCVPGSAAGPDSGTCGLYDYGSYCDPYQGASSAACLGHGGCGWCTIPGYGGACFSGDVSGPHMSSLSCGSWEFSTLPPPPPVDTNPPNETQGGATGTNPVVPTGDGPEDSGVDKDSDSDNTDGAVTTTASAVTGCLVGLLCLLAGQN